MSVAGEGSGQSLEARFDPDHLRAPVQSLNDFIAELGLECRRNHGGRYSDCLYVPAGSQIQIVPLDGTALPVDKYRGLHMGRFLTYNKYVPREVGEPLDVSFFRFYFLDARLCIEAVFRREALNIDEVLDLTGLEIPFDIVKTESIMP